MQTRTMPLIVRVGQKRSFNRTMRLLLFPLAKLVLLAESMGGMHIATNANQNAGGNHTQKQPSQQKKASQKREAFE